MSCRSIQIYMKPCVKGWKNDNTDAEGVTQSGGLPPPSFDGEPLPGDDGQRFKSSLRLAALPAALVH